jgi:hypothetical protein
LRRRNVRLHRRHGTLCSNAFTNSARGRWLRERARRSLGEAWWRVT